MNEPRPDIDALIDELAADIKSALRDDVVGVYLYGSYVSGGFDATGSDLDVVVVTSREVDVIGTAKLEPIATAFIARHPDWRDRLDIDYVGRGSLESFRSTAGFVGVASRGDSFQMVALEPDWVLTWFPLRTSGVVVDGPAPTEVVPEIAREEFVAAVARHVARFQARRLEEMTPGLRAYVVLTVCRALRTVRLGVDSSKEEGAAWVKQEMPEWGWLIDAALRCRACGGAVGFDDERTLTAARTLTDEIAGQLQRSG